MHSLSRGSQTLQEPLVSRLAIQYTPQLHTPTAQSTRLLACVQPLRVWHEHSVPECLVTIRDERRRN